MEVVSLDDPTLKWAIGGIARDSLLARYNRDLFKVSCTGISATLFC